MATKKKAKPAPEPEAVEEELEETESDEELEEMDEAEEEGTATKSKAQEVTFGASDLAKHISEKTGKDVSARELRTLIRKMARDGSGRIDREITQGNRVRYNWSGPEDPEVKAIIKAYEGGELEADKQAKLAELKERKAKQKAEAGDKPKEKAKGKKGKGSKAKAQPEPEEVDDDDEDLELDD